ncbi:alpha/beta fold hydrolase [Alphaproteobacteria bacterium]|nr:alpha/beta fold hydrolase [Alphaproteobacteria bacterium]MDC1022949.1 alpha/beta fold hydrolase [Alphaproteobacteria bacterium]
MNNFQLYKNGNLINYDLEDETFNFDDSEILFIFHGLFGRGKNWQTFSKILTMNEDIVVITVDLRNHGGNEFKKNHSYSLMVADIVDLFNHLNIKKTNILGHSMGGKLGMLLILNYPQYINKLIVADIAPVDYPVEQNSIVEGLLSLDLDLITTRHHADQLLSNTIKEKFIRTFLIQNLELHDNKYRWSINLLAIKESMDNLRSFPLFEKTKTVEHKILCIYGENSDYVTKENINIFNNFFSNISFVEIKKAGHYLHVEQPKEFHEAVRNFLIN